MSLRAVLPWVAAVCAAVLPAPSSPGGGTAATSPPAAPMVGVTVDDVSNLGQIVDGARHLSTRPMTRIYDARVSSYLQVLGDDVDNGAADQDAVRSWWMRGDF